MTPVKIHKLIRSRRRTIALEITPNAVLVVRAPLAEPLARIEDFVREKAGWIRRHINKVVSQPRCQAKEFVEGEEFLYLGEKYKLRLVDKADAPLAFQGDFILNRACQPFAKQMFVNWYTKEAKKIIGERVEIVASKFGFTYRGVNITSAHRRWGSCSAVNGLNFTWRLVMTPLSVVDYVIIHELAHTREKNHSHKFWRLVATVMPDYRIHLTWLKKNEKSLNL